MPATADKFSRLSALKPARPVAARPTSLRAPDEEDSLAQLLGAGVAKNHFGEHLSIRNWFSTPEYSEASSASLDLLSRARDESLSRRTRAALADPEKWLFLDTETTGLAGGTGTYAFLVGLAWWDAGGLQVEQFFMRDFSEEHSLLHELSARVASRPVLVTFNGKSFDWPLLESRFTMTRSIAVPKLAAHLDLLHPARALWKLRLGSVRLVELERHVLDAPRLGWRRDDDVSSALIPQFYFDYLRGGPAEPLAGVVRHNQMDLRELALMAKRRGEHDRAAEIWQEIVADAQDGIYACEQLAIHFERHAKNLSCAAEFAQLGLAKLRCQRSASRDPYFAARCTRLEQKFLHRIARLRHQMRISDGLATPLALSVCTGEPGTESRCRHR